VSVPFSAVAGTIAYESQTSSAEAWFAAAERIACDANARTVVPEQGAPLKVFLRREPGSASNNLAEEATRSDGAFVAMLAKVPVLHESTLYQKWGDWFAWADLVALAMLVTFLLPNRKLQPRKPDERATANAPMDREMSSCESTFRTSFQIPHWRILPSPKAKRGRP